MARIAITDGMAKEAIEILHKNGHEVIEKHYSEEELLSGALKDFDAIVVRSATKLTKEVIMASKSDDRGIVFIGRAGVGVDNIDLETASGNGITVCNTPQSSTQSVVELTIGHLLASVRHIATGDRKLRDGVWAKKDLRGTELSGKNLGLIGYGRIAQGVGKVASALGMNLHCYDPYLPKDIARMNNCVIHDDVDDVFKMCTHISIHCNFSEETHHLVNNKRIIMMPKIGDDGIKCGRHIINCARGGIVDEKAIGEALENGELTTAGLDVFEVEPPMDSNLLQYEQFHGTPHIGAATIEAQRRIGEEMILLLSDYFEGKIPHSKLN